LCARSGGKEELRRKNKRDWLKSEMEYVEEEDKGRRSK
jgi:hypothetical protein